MKRILLTALGTVVLATGLIGCSAPQSGPVATPAGTAAAKPAPTQNAPTIGQPFTVKQSNGTAKVTIVKATYGPKLGGDFDQTAKNGGYLILDVLWETTKGTSTANPMYFAVKTADGVAGSMALGAPTPLASGDVPVGDKSRGSVAFDIGKGPYTIIVTDELLQEQARITGAAAN